MIANCALVENQIHSQSRARHIPLFDTLLFRPFGLGANLIYTPSTICRRSNQALDSIIRLVTGLEDRIEDLMPLHISDPQRTIRTQSLEIKRYAQTIANKDAEMVAAHQLNRQLQTRIRELEKSLEAESLTTEPPH